jgi:drug/metabolite transporter (DMT)-like permease
MEHYADIIPADAPAHMNTLLPFASTMIRAVVGAAGFLALMALQNKTKELRAATHDRKGLGYALIMTLFGPVIGVSLSLMAVRYTSAGIASTLMALTPVFILIPYAFIYHQRIRARELVGVLVSMTGVALFFLL